MNETELRARFPNASTAFIRSNTTEPGQTPAHSDDPGAASELEPSVGNGNVAALQSKAGVGRRFLVHVKSYRKRLLDQDNLCCKYLVDLCRYSGMLPSDAPGTAEIKVSQEKVGPKEAERTEIQIFEI